MSAPSPVCLGNPHAMPIAELTKAKLLNIIGSSTSSRTQRKVTVVGAGAVGLAAAYAILNQGICSELALCDVNRDKVRGEGMDLMHGAAFLKKCTIKASDDLSISANSDVVVITAGARQLDGEDRLSLVGRNVNIFKTLIPALVKHSPNAVLIIASNPVDIMTYVTVKLSGLPAGRVFGTGTSLDSSRFRALCAERLDVDSRSVHACIIGEHGDTSVALWSLLNVGGARLKDLSPAMGTDNDPENWKAVHHEVIHSAYKIIKAKGYTNWAIGTTCAHLVENVLRNERRVIPVSVSAKGQYGIEHDVYLSLPAMLTHEGVNAILTPILEDSEVALLRKSADTIALTQKSIEHLL